MQQAIITRDESRLAVPAGPPTEAPRPANAFVINLCSSTTPVALAPPDHAGLKRFNFFVSRRREEGRERFRLHMGYFGSQEEAEKLLDIVREIYPGAWAGLAPGQRLRARGQGGALGELPANASSPAAAAPAAPLAAAPSTSIASMPPAELTLAAAELALVPDAGRRLPAPTAEVPVQAAAAAQSLNNVRAAIASLQDPTAPTLRPIPELKAAPVLSDSGVLRMLEGNARDAAPTLRAPREPAPARPAVLPGSPQRPAADRMREIAEARARDEKAQYAVQLMWSVKPIDISHVPQLAIFSAYTLYGAEGNRDGRRWYGIRLGFFTDAVSAKQVAHYVRSDFATVSVVPVTVRERERARLAAARPPTAAPATPPASSPAAAAAAAAANGAPKAPPETFEFIDDRQRTPEGAAFRADGSPSPTPGPRPATPGRATRGAPGKRAKLRPSAGARVQAKAAARPMTLEETLEILGAGQLEMDDGRKALINDSGVRHLQYGAAKPGKPSRLGRLFERLAERLGT